MDGFQCIARISGVELAVARDPDSIIRFHQSRAMRQLYDMGCRRFVAPERLQPNGDGERYRVRGFIE